VKERLRLISWAGRDSSLRYRIGGNTAKSGTSFMAVALRSARPAPLKRYILVVILRLPPMVPAIGPHKRTGVHFDIEAAECMLMLLQLGCNEFPAF
jgi:hypothetical protein